MKTFSVLASLVVIVLISSWVTAQSIGDVKKGAAIYQENCLRCHGVSGDGNGPDSKFLVVGPASFQADQFRLKPDWELLDTIAYGIIFSPMHGWRHRLSDEEMLDVLAYIRKLGFLGSIT